MSVALSYKGKSQADIHEAVCAMSQRILLARKKTGYGAASDLQRLRRDRADLQALLNKPTLVWVNPNEPIDPDNLNPCCERLV